MSERIVKRSHRETDPWTPRVQISRQADMELYECLPHEMLNAARIWVRKADRQYAHATHQSKAEKKTKFHGRALWCLCQAAFCQLVAEVMFETETQYVKDLSHAQLELCWQEGIHRANAAAKQAGRKK